MIPVPVILTATVSSFLLSLLAIGFTMQYITMRIPNLAYADIAFASAYVTLILSLWKVDPYFGVSLAFVLGGFVSFLLYRFMAFLRDRGTSWVALMISTLIFDLTIYGVMNIFADYVSYYFKVYARSFSLTEVDFHVGGLPGIFYISMITAILLVAVLHALLVKTKFGIAMRAVMENYSLADIHGIDTERVLSLSWFFVGGIAGIAGSLYPMWFEMDPWVGVTMLVSIFAACVVGGLKSIYGSLAGGFIIGYSEILITYGLAVVFGGWMWSYRSATSMVIASLVLLIMPEGLAGFVNKIRTG